MDYFVAVMKLRICYEEIFPDFGFRYIIDNF